ncbi:MAG: methylated-DNA--[protein]-cysteine S-methyltransferase, partial [Caulobacteraceae bacterium]
MTGPGYAFFETAIGRCGIAWSGEGISATALPGDPPARLRRKLARRSPAAIRSADPPPPVAAVIADIQALFAGEPRDLSTARLDLAGASDFHRRAWTAARAIPPGETATYGEIAARLGEKSAARAVGAAMAANPFPIIVPCHRVIAAGGAIGGFSAPGGVSTKARMLAIEQAMIGTAPSL